MAKITKEEQQILSDILTKQLQITHHYDNRANFILAISSGLFLFALNGITTKETGNASLLFLAATSFISGTLCLFTIKPPRISGKIADGGSLLYHDKIAQLGFKNYEKELDITLKDRKKVIEEYAREITNLVSYHLMVKKIFFRLAIPILLLGLIGSLILFYVAP